MKKFLVILIIGMLFSTFGPASQASDGLGGSYIDNPVLMKKYGEYAFEAVKNQNVLRAVRVAKPDFQPKNVGTSFPSSVFKTNDGRTYLMFSGCTPHNCGGTQNVIVYDPAQSKAYLYSEKEDKFFGNPPEQIKRLIIYHYNNF